MKLSVIIPVYNEIGTLAELIRRVQRVPIEKEILVVDDGSTDGSCDLVRELAIAKDTRAFFHDTNRGKGAAFRTALSNANGDVVLVQDADLEYDPADYQKLLAPIETYEADVVYGSRFLGSESHRVLYFWHSATEI